MSSAIMPKSQEQTFETNLHRKNKALADFIHILSGCHATKLTIQKKPPITWGLSISIQQPI
ncbi:hypothetical protein EDF67_105164 [Sphingobacterium sp. JUb78]|nr:hypothetical protein L950_0218790 [Sphingobacterium sp. IITKGP-BTPF85]MBB2953139.1 hypothetical protein [Sphingobacterium sp. JUb56]MCW2261583.1 hypothetical protein [Sphingobacterium kitahiroshimense]TCR09894.1 hypothetical protein EDF67_105164 [Sphingobacterium sp. JUb78]